MPDRVMPFLKDWWPILAVVGAGLIAWGTTQGTISAIQDDIAEIKAGAARETRQWQKIAENAGEIASHEQRLSEIERHTTPQAIQRWGQIQATVDEDHRLLQDHIRSHP